MPRHRRFATGSLITVLVISACVGQFAATNEPTSAPTASTTPSPAATTGPIVTEVPTDSPTALPSESATTSPTSSPTSSPPASPTDGSAGAWRRTVDFPPADGTVSSIVAGGPGLVAVGSVPGDSGECEEGRDGRIWTSPDGGHWTQAIRADAAGVELVSVVNADGNLYAFGQIGSRECAQGVVIWRSSDGADWQQLPQSPTFRRGDGIIDVTVSGDVLIAVGYLNGVDESTGVWTSGNGIDWVRSKDSPQSWLNEVDAVASVGSVVVALTAFHAQPVWYSSDRGRSWQRSSFGPLHRTRGLDVVGSNGLIVAGGSACCGLPNQEVGVAMSSRDGSTWTLSEPRGFRGPTEHVVALPEGFLAVGRRTRLSVDGVAWQAGPPLPDLDPHGWTAGAATDEVVVVASGGSAWLMPTDELRIDRWPDGARAAEMPELGVRYPYELFTHCGIPPIHFALGTWLPEGDPGINPPPGIDDFDRGWLTQVSTDLAEYESRRGRRIQLHRADEPEEIAPCA